MAFRFHHLGYPKHGALHSGTTSGNHRIEHCCWIKDGNQTELNVTPVLPVVQSSAIKIKRSIRADLIQSSSSSLSFPVSLFTSTPSLYCTAVRLNHLSLQFTTIRLRLNPCPRLFTTTWLEKPRLPVAVPHVKLFIFCSWWLLIPFLNE